MKRNTSRHHRTARQNVLHLRVVSPRIVWFGVLRCTRGLFQIAALTALLGGLGWAAWQGIQRVVYQNPDFQLKVIDLNPNPVIDELDVAKLADIDLTRSPSLFEIDVSATLRKLKALPAITEAKVERHMPDTLLVRVTTRTPRAWITTSHSAADTRRADALLVDALGVAYPCPTNQLEACTPLPVIELPADPAHELQPGKPITHPSLPYYISLLDAASQADPESVRWIDSIRQSNQWSLLITTRDATRATFSLGDHPEQIARLRAALDHASAKGLSIASINLIPRHNVPVTLREDIPAHAPRAIPVVIEEKEEEAPAADTRRSRDLNSILTRP
jgi:hypothetical protein